MKTLPLFYYPSTYVWVDDEKSFLNVMVDFFGKENAIHSFLSANEAIHFFKHYESPLSKYHFLTSNKEDENYGLLEKTPIDFNITELIKLSMDEKRYEEISILIMDYHMPEIDGLSLAKKIDFPLIQKILLTGTKEEAKVIEGFNDGLIQCFFQKGHENLSQKIKTYLKKLSLGYFEKITAPLLAALEADHPLPLSDNIFINFFEDYCEDYFIEEYYLIDKEGSFLCIDKEGGTSYLVIHTERSIQKWLSFHQAETEFNQEDLKSIQEYKKIPFFGPGKEAWSFEPSEWSEYLYTPNILEGREKYFWVRVG